MNTTAIGSALIAAGLFLSGVSPVYADFKTYAASECERWNQDPAVEPDSYLNSSRRFNPSEVDVLFLDCPAIHDRNAKVASSWIRVIDQHPDQDICAALAAFQQIGAAFFSAGTPFKCTTGVASPNSVQLNTGALGVSPVGAHYYFSVQSVPMRFNGADSGVVTYSVNEVNGSD